MARYTGPTTKKSRSFGESLYGYDKYFEKRKYPPGQHGQTRKRKAGSDYSRQLSEKQKAKYTYGILEKQFWLTFVNATRRHGVTGEWLLQLLEARLDNTVYRLGIAPTRRAARQLVLHKHITVNDSVVNIPSYTLKPGDLIGVRDKSKTLEVIKDNIAAPHKGHMWLEWDSTQMRGKLMALPSREEIPEKINEQSIVELYSK